MGAAPDLRPDLYEAACPTKSQIWSRLRSDIVLATGTEGVDVPVELTRLFYHRLDQGLAGPRLFEYREPAGCDRRRGRRGSRVRGDRGGGRGRAATAGDELALINFL